MLERSTRFGLGNFAHGVGIRSVPERSTLNYYDLTLSLPKFFIDNQVKRKSSIKFLGILLDENLSWKEHLKLTENKTAKNIGLTYEVKPYLNIDSLLALYFFFIIFTLTLIMLI